MINQPEFEDVFGFVFNCFLSLFLQLFFLEPEVALSEEYIFLISVPTSLIRNRRKTAMQ